jgi:hypothetical protein
MAIKGYPAFSEIKNTLKRHYPDMPESTIFLLGGFVVLYCTSIGPTRTYLRDTIKNALREAAHINQQMKYEIEDVIEDAKSKKEKIYN